MRGLLSLLLSLSPSGVSRGPTTCTLQRTTRRPQTKQNKQTGDAFKIRLAHLLFFLCFFTFFPFSFLPLLELLLRARVFTTRWSHAAFYQYTQTKIKHPSSLSFFFPYPFLFTHFKCFVLSTPLVNSLPPPPFFLFAIYYQSIKNASFRHDQSHCLFFPPSLPPSLLSSIYNKKCLLCTCSCTCLPLFIKMTDSLLFLFPLLSSLARRTG